jgi:hypothetical protein
LLSQNWSSAFVGRVPPPQADPGSVLSAANGARRHLERDIEALVQRHNASSVELCPWWWSDQLPRKLIAVGLLFEAAAEAPSRYLATAVVEKRMGEFMRNPEFAAPSCRGSLLWIADGCGAEGPI